MEELKEVTLRPWPAQEKKELSLEELHLQVEQLTSERGHLRDITELSLQEAIAAGKDVPNGVSKNADQEKTIKEAPSAQEAREKVFNAGRDMYGHLEWAKFAATNALDLISLVLSKDPRGQNPASFSQTFREQGLNQGIPFGSFVLSRENHEYHNRQGNDIQQREELEARQEVVAKGARMEALDTAADDILKAAKQLEKEVRRETKYWQEIVSVSEKGWPIQRLRQNARHVPFGVRYGLPEAGDHFKARGFAPLRMDKDGSIILDPALTVKPKTFRVRVRVNGKITGTSQLPSSEDVAPKAIEKSIQLARDSLFEEELFHEMSLETRQLAAYGVEFRNSTIQVDAPRSGGEFERQLLIDCIPRDDVIPTDQEHSDDWLAKQIAESLRLLLVHEHSMRLHRRSQLPAPLTSHNQEKQSPPLLRTLLAVLNHLQSVDSLYVYLEALTQTLKSAGIDLSLETTREVSWARLAEVLLTTGTDVSATDRLLETFIKPFEGKATMTIPVLPGAQSETLVVFTRTIIGQPTFGTEHRLNLPASLISDLGLSTQLKFSSASELKSYLDWIFSLFVAHRVVQSAFLPQGHIENREPKIRVVVKGGKKASAMSKCLSVECREGRMTVTAKPGSSTDADADATELFTWDGTGTRLSLVDWIKGLAG
ncbi:RNA polymerase II mediator complex subunit [Coniothyrium glycines]